MSSKNSKKGFLDTPLDELKSILDATTLQSTLTKNGIEVSNGRVTVNVEIKKPSTKNVKKNIRAIIDVRSELQPDLLPIVNKMPSMMNQFNSLATFSALTKEKDRYYLGSRITVHEDENNWPFIFNLLLYTLIIANDTFSDSVHHLLGGETNKPSSNTSDWILSDFDIVQKHLSKSCVCTSGETGFTAEFSTIEGSVSAATGQRNTALFRMMTNMPHPILGGGLFCLLELPFKLESEEKVLEAVNVLNMKEMSPEDLPPHLGSWVQGNLKTNPAYVAFLPNILHKEVPYIASSMAIWAKQRTNLALSSLSLGGYI